MSCWVRVCLHCLKASFLLLIAASTSFVHHQVSFLMRLVPGFVTPNLSLATFRTASAHCCQLTAAETVGLISGIALTMSLQACSEDCSRAFHHLILASPVVRIFVVAFFVNLKSATTGLCWGAIISFGSTLQSITYLRELWWTRTKSIWDLCLPDS